MPAVPATAGTGRGKKAAGTGRGKEAAGTGRGKEAAGTGRGKKAAGTGQAAPARRRAGANGKGVPRLKAERAAAAIRRHLTFPPAAKAGRRGTKRRRFPTRIVGSLRRKAPRVKDLDILIVVPDGTRLEGLLPGAELAEPAAAARGGPVIVETRAGGPRRRSAIVAWGRGEDRRAYAVDFFVATQSELPYALLAHSGPREYVVALRAHAKRQGLRLNQYGLYKAATGASLAGPRPSGEGFRPRTEREVVTRLGATYRPPAQRR